MGDKKKTEYPVVFEKCPLCGCSNKLGETLIAELKDEGNLAKDSFDKGFLVDQFPLVDMGNPPATIHIGQMSVKVACTYWDICAGCGHKYITKFDCLDGQAFVGPQQSPGSLGFKR